MNVLESLRRGWRLLLLVAIPLAAGVVLSAESLADEYRATAVVSYAPRVEPEAAGVGADVVRLVVPKYETYVQSNATIQRAAEQLDVPMSEIEDGLSAAIPPDTSNLEITVSGSNPRRVARAANILANQAVAFSENDPLLVGSSVARAAEPQSPSGPPRRLLEVAGVLAALLLGAGAALLVDRLRPVVRTANDVGEAAQVRVLGVLPRTRALRAPRQAIGNSRVGPAIRSIRTQLSRAAMRNGEPRGFVLVVTSAERFEGRTTVSSLLAIASARVGQRVLLLEGDLTSPDLADVFTVPAEPGVRAALQDEQFDERVVLRPDVVPGLTLMPSGPDPDAGDLIARDMERLLAWGARRFDLVIVDAPPVLGDDAAQKLATLADGVVLVVGRGTRGHLVEDSVRTLRSLDAKVIGAVANDVRQGDQVSVGV